EEEKQLVLAVVNFGDDHRTADGEGEMVLVAGGYHGSVTQSLRQGHVARSHCRVDVPEVKLFWKKRRSVPAVLGVQVAGAAVELVGTGLRHDRDGDPCGMAKGGVEARSLNLHFRHRVAMGHVSHNVARAVGRA